MNQQLKSMKYYFSKLLLFGEYSVINGSRALAAPLSKFKGYWYQAYLISIDSRTKDQRLLLMLLSFFLLKVIFSNLNKDTINYCCFY